MTKIEQIPDGVEAHVSPTSFEDGDPITIEIIGATRLADTTMNLTLTAATAVDTHWTMQAPVYIDESGHGTLSLPEGLDLGHEASVFVEYLQETDDHPNPARTDSRLPTPASRTPRRSPRHPTTQPTSTVESSPSKWPPMPPQSATRASREL